MWASVGSPIVQFTSKTKDTMYETTGPNAKAGIVISTYNMLSYRGDRGE